MNTPVLAPGGLPLPAGQGRHLTRRLLIEQVGPDRHYVFNPLSGALDLLTDREVGTLAALRENGRTLLSDSEEANLRERRYLFNSAEQEEVYLETAVDHAWKRMLAFQPEAYVVCPTLACNLACAYCFEGDSLTDKAQGVMTPEQVKLVFRAIQALRPRDRDTLPGAANADRYVPWISLFGGEPFLPSTRRCVEQILQEAASEDFLVSATTNGVNLVPL